MAVGRLIAIAVHQHGVIMRMLVRSGEFCKASERETRLSFYRCGARRYASFMTDQ